MPNTPSIWQIWLLTARPKTLWAGITPVLIGTCMAAEQGRFHLVAALAALTGALLIQVGTNYANDYLDFIRGTDTSSRIGPARAALSGWVSPQSIRNAAILIYALAFIPGSYIVWRAGWPFIIIGLASIASGVAYTAGRYALSYTGLADIFVVVFFGPVAVAGTYYVQALSLSPGVLLAGVASGMLALAMLTVNNLRDIEEDRLAAKLTLAVRFGLPFARAEYAFALCCACFIIPVCLACLSGKSLLLIAALLSTAAATPIVKTIFTKTDGPTLNHALASTGKLMLLHAALFSIAWLFG